MSFANDILDGIFCEDCGVVIGDPVGFPQKCEQCKPSEKSKKSKPKKKNKKRPRI